MAAAEKSVAAIIPRRHVVTTDCMGALDADGMLPRAAIPAAFFVVAGIALSKLADTGRFVGLSLVSASFESAGLVAARASSRKGPVSGLRDGTFSGCGGNRHDGDPVIVRRPRWRGAVAKRLGRPNLLQDTEGPPKPMRILVSAGLRAICECAPNVTRLRDHRMPCATMALATLTKPAALAPSIRSPSWPYSLAAARESATMVSMMFLSLASTSSKGHDRR